MTNEPVFRLQSVLFVRGNGGFGHKGSIKLAIPKIPEREADKFIEEPTLPNSAFLYRLNGDLNPQHVDPELSTFERPIMHGLCTYGFTARAISDLYEQAMLKRISGRFTSHVFPGETLRVKTWEQDGQIVFWVPGEGVNEDEDWSSIWQWAREVWLES